MNFAEEFANLTAAIRATLGGERDIEPARHRRLAERYAGFAARLNRRLHGDREAAEAPPSEKYLLTGSEYDRWLGECLRRNWPVPERVVPADYDLPGNRPFDDLSPAELAEYYRANIRTLSDAARLAVLRRLREVDPGTPDWEREAGELSPTVADEAIREAEAAIRAASLPRLERALRTLEHPDFAGRIKPAVTDRCRREIAGLRTRELAERAGLLLDAIDTVYAAQDADGLDRILEVWNREVARDPEFAAAAIPVERLTEPAGWLKQIRIGEERRRRFREACDRLEKAVAGDAGSGAVAAACDAFGPDTGEAPDELLRRAGDYFAMDLKRQRRRARIRALAALTVTLIGVAALAAGLYGYNNYRNRLNTATRIARLQQEGRLADAQVDLDRLAEKQPRLFAHPEIRVLSVRQRELLEEEEERAAAFAAACERMTGIAAGGFAGVAAYRMQLATAEELARGLDETHAAARFRLQLQQHLDDEQTKTDRAALERVDQLAQTVRQTLEADFRDSLDDAGRAADGLLREIAGLRREIPTSAEALAFLRQIEDQVTERRAAIGEKQRQAEELAAAKRELLRFEGDLAELRGELERFAAAHRQNHPGDPLIAAAAGWEEFMALGALARYNAMSEIGYEALRKEVSSLPADAWWRETAARLDELYLRQHARDASARELLDVTPAVLSRQCLRFKSADGGIREFYAHYTLERRPKMTFHEGWTTITANVYDAPNHTVDASFASDPQDPTRWQAQLGNRSLEFSGYKLDDLQAMPFEAALRSLHHLRQSPPASAWLIKRQLADWLARIADDRELNPGVKYLVCESFLELTRDPDLPREARERAAETWSRIETLYRQHRLNYYAITPEEFAAGNELFGELPYRDIAAAFEALDAGDALDAEMLLLTSTLSMQLRPAGIVVGAEPLLAAAGDGSLWMVELQEGRPVSCRVLGRIADGRFLTSTGAPAPVEGAWLYLVPASFDAAGRKAEIDQLTGAAPLPYPKIWPDNL